MKFRGRESRVHSIIFSMRQFRVGQNLVRMARIFDRMYHLPPFVYGPYTKAHYPSTNLCWKHGQY